jgi:hypothetical protein
MTCTPSPTAIETSSRCPSGVQRGPAMPVMPSAGLSDDGFPVLTGDREFERVADLVHVRWLLEPT